MKAEEVNDSLQMARSFRSIGVEYMYASLYDYALEYLEKALEVAKALEHQRAIAAIYNNMADCFSMQGKRDESFVLYDQMAEIYLSIPDSASYAGLLINLAAEYQDMGETAEALEKALLALQIKEETKDSVQLAFFYVKIAELFEAHNPEAYRNWLLNAYNLSKTPAYTTFYTNITIYNNMAKMYRDEGNYDLAIAWYDSVYTVAHRHDHQAGMEVGSSNMAMVYAQMGQNKKALEMHKLALIISGKGQNVFRHTGHAINAGKLEATLGNFSQSLPLLIRGYELATEHNFPEYKMEALAALSETYVQLNHWQKAFQKYKQYTVLKDSLEGVRVKETLLELEKQFETEKKEKQIALLQAQNLSVLKHRRLLSLAIFFIFVVAAAMVWLVRLRNKKLMQQNQMAEQRKEIYRLNQENLKLSLDQKNRELSSMAMQMVQRTEFLTGLKKQLDANDPEKLPAQIKLFEKQISRSNDWEAFRIHFEEVHPSFFKALLKLFPSLTFNEQKLCAFLKMNLTSKEIAAINNNTVAAVDKSRNRLRKKIGISPDQNLGDFLNQFTY